MFHCAARLARTALAASAALLSLAGCDYGDQARPAGESAPVAAARADADTRAAEKAAYDAALARAKAAAAASRGSGTPALWTLKDADTTVHLIGTVHLLRPDLEWRSPQINAALDAAGRVVFEIDLDSPAASRAVMAFISEHGLSQDGRTLTSLLSAEEAKSFKTAAAKADLPYEALETLKPWYAAVNLTSSHLMKNGFDPEAGVDSVIEAEARASGKTLSYLETPEEQLGRLADLPEDEQIDFLIGTTDSIDTLPQDLDLLVSEWADGDAAGLAALLTEPELIGSQRLHDAMLIERNRDWVPKIEALLETRGTVLVAVGAAHLVGEDSVVDLLREKGHEVTGP